MDDRMEEPVDAVEICYFCDGVAHHFTPWSFEADDFFPGSKAIHTNVAVCPTHGEMIVNTMMSIQVLATTVS